MFHDWSLEQLRFYAQSQKRPLRASLRRAQLMQYVDQMPMFTHTFERLGCGEEELSQIQRRFPDLVVVHQTAEHVTMTTRMAKGHFLSLGILGDVVEATYLLRFDASGHDIHDVLSNVYFAHRAAFVSIDRVAEASFVTVRTSLSIKHFTDTGIFHLIDGDAPSTITESIDNESTDNESIDNESIGNECEDCKEQVTDSEEEDDETEAFDGVRRHVFIFDSRYDIHDVLGSSYFPKHACTLIRQEGARVVIDSSLPSSYFLDSGAFFQDSGVTGGIDGNRQMVRKKYAVVEHIRTTREESADGSPEFIPYPVTGTGEHYLAPEDRLFRARVPNAHLITAPIRIHGTGYTINSNHPDVVLYVHPMDVLAGQISCRTYDYMYRELGVIDTHLLLISPVTFANSIAGYICRYMTPVYMNTVSLVVYVQLVRGTPVQSTHRINGRIYVYTQTSHGEWIGRGWVDDASFRVTVPRVASKVPMFTLARYIWAKMKGDAGTREEQYDPALGFSKFILPGVLYNAYNTEPHFICPGTHEWFIGRQEQHPQPLSVGYTRGASDTVMSVRMLVKQTLRSPIIEESAVSRSQCASSSGGKTSHMMIKILPTSTPIPCIVLAVVRNELFLQPRATVESLPVRPSLYLTIFTKRYKLVSFSIKTGSQTRGHWMACVNTTTGWYLMDDGNVTRIEDIKQVTNGVQFVYEEEDMPLFAIDKTGLENPGLRCWANTFTQMVRYAPTFASTLGITGRLPTFNELFGLIDQTVRK